MLADSSPLSKCTGLELLDALPQALLVSDPEGVIVYAHPLAERPLGLARGAAAGTPLSQCLVSLAGEPYSHGALAKRVSHDAGVPIAAELRHAGGMIFRVLLSARESTLGGKPLWFLALQPYPVAEPAPADRDVYRAVFECAPIGICHTNEHGLITAVNEAFASSIGSPRALLLGLNALTLPNQAMVQQIKSALTGKLVHYEGPYRSATANKVVDIRLVIAPIVDEKGQIAGSVTLVSDISAQVEAGRALDRSFQALHRLIESAPDAICVLREGKFVSVNACAAEILGSHDSDSLIGRKAVDFVHADEVSLLEQRMAAMSKGSALEPQEYRLRRSDGEYRRVEVKSLPFEYDARPALLVFGRDVTERRDLEARLQEADRMAAVGTLAAGVAHEINNPLSYVIMIADLLAKRVRAHDLDETALLRDIDLVLEGSERIRTIVRDLSAFSRRDDAPTSALDLNQVVQAALNMVRHTVRHSARLTVELAPNLPPVRGDQGRLTQVFVNLLVNAAQAMPVGQASEHTIVVRTELVGNQVRARVSDDGVGMAESVAGRIFQPFFTTKVGVGSGLGLSICHGIVRSHGGTIRVETELGKGSEFILDLPRAGEGEPARAALATHDEPVNEARILIIDDELLFAEALKDTLKGHHLPSTAIGGRAGLKAILAESEAPDLILCDVMMSDLSGPELFAALQKERPELSRRFMFMTGGAVTEQAQKALSQSGQPVLAKPFTRHELEAALRQLQRS